MWFVASLAARSLLAFGLLLLIVQFAAYAAGYWIAQRRKFLSGNRSEGVPIVVGGMLALLAFVLALTLSFASARFTELRVGALAESNAIGTAWLRAQTIGGDR